MTTPLRVVHAPARTPYARKLTDDRVRLVNGTAPFGGEAVPRDMSLRWLLDHRPFTWFDVLHLHHVEFDELRLLKSVLAECSRQGRRVVFTAHDVDPVFEAKPAYHRKLRTLADADVPFVCLTEASEKAVHRRLGSKVRTVTIPHGYVIAPGTAPDRAPADRDYFLFGSLRDNRDIETVLHNWRLGRRQRDTTLSLLLRAPGRVNLEQERGQWSLLSGMAASEPRLRVDVLPFPSDDEVAETAAGHRALVLPYRWASHSGQLELAFDLGMLPVASAVGHLRDQHRLHQGLVEEPVWFDWSDGAEYAYGARFLEALDEAAARIRETRPAGASAEFTAYRRHEHTAIMDAYLEVYACPWR
ncbi:hypothetical protein [Streptomyces sp. NPDC013181]|uniref:hypothetical protein n=1 Tax=unclassified Streptomyces TaxID=2593676 RepID=UPI00369E2F1F